ncbi:MAG: DUF4340 domain-containing protein [Calditrichaeota bacterium]|nr:MAG: DUF4340 domain-containing protein [Calditrichota bacterium]
MKGRNLLLMFLVFILLGGYVYLVEIKQHEKKQKAEEAAAKLFDFVKDSLATVEIVKAKDHIVVAKTESGWKIIQPLETDADESVMNTLLNNLKDAKKEQEFEVKPGEWASYGLGNRGIKVKLTFRDGRTDSAFFGDPTPVGSNAFAAKDSTHVFTVKNYIKSSVDKNLFALRDKRYLRFKRDQVQKIVLIRGKEKIELEKSGPNEWRLVNLDRPADGGKIGALLSKLEFNRTKGFVDEEGKQLRKYGLEPPAYKVELYLGPERAKQVLRISKKLHGKYYAWDESRKPIFELDEAVVTDISRPLNEYRNKDFAKVDREKVNRIEILYGDTSLVCTQDSLEKEWYLQQKPEPARVKKAKISTFLSNLDFKTIREFVSDNPTNLARYGLEKPRLVVRLFNNKDLLLEARFGKVKDKKVYAMTNQYNSVYLIDAVALKQLKLKADDIIDRLTHLETGKQKSS